MKDGSMKLQKSEIAKVFWTGGCDSTFRVLQLVFLEKRKVQPYYIVDPSRKSTDAEFKAMDQIKEQLFYKYPAAKELLLSTIVGNVKEIEPYQQITSAYQSIIKREDLGIQYEFLARYCVQEGNDNIEMSIEDGPTVPLITSQQSFVDKADQDNDSNYGLTNVYTLLQSFAIKIDQDNYSNYRLDAKYEGTDVYTLFKYFRYPILFITKLDMQDIAIKEEFEDLMELTWFCHHPLKRGNHYEPCGTCYPCRLIMEVGMRRRMPLRSKIRYYFRVRSRMEKLSRKYPKFFAFARKWKRKLLKK